MTSRLVVILKDGTVKMIIPDLKTAVALLNDLASGELLVFGSKGEATDAIATMEKAASNIAAVIRVRDVSTGRFSVGVRNRVRITALPRGDESHYQVALDCPACGGSIDSGAPEWARGRSVYCSPLCLWKG